MSDTSIAAAVWAYANRTTTAGQGHITPTTRLEKIARTAWEYGTRTLTTGGTTPTVGALTLGGVGPVLDLGIRPRTAIRGG